MSSRDQQWRGQRESDGGIEEYKEKDRRGRSKKSSDRNIPLKRVPSTNPDRPRKPVTLTITTPQKIPPADFKCIKPRKPRPEPGPDPHPPPPPPPPPTPPPPSSQPENTVPQLPAFSVSSGSSLSGDAFSEDKTCWNTQFGSSIDQDITMLSQSPESINTKVNGIAVTVAFTLNSEDSFISCDFAKLLKVKAKLAKSRKTYCDSIGNKRPAHMRIKTHFEYNGRIIDDQCLYLVSGSMEMPIMVGSKLKSQLLLENFPPTHPSAELTPRSRPQSTPCSVDYEYLLSSKESSMIYSYSNPKQYYPVVSPPTKVEFNPATQRPFPNMSDVVGSLPRHESYDLSSRYTDTQDVRYSYSPQSDIQPPSDEFQGLESRSTDSAQNQDKILSNRLDSTRESSIHNTMDGPSIAIAKGSYYSSTSVPKTEYPKTSS